VLLEAGHATLPPLAYTVVVQRGKGARMRETDRANNVLLVRALRLGARIPPELKEKILEEMGEILATAKSRRSKVSAARVVMALEQAEVAAIETVMNVEARLELEARLKALESQREAADVI